MAWDMDRPLPTSSATALRTARPSSISTAFAPRRLKDLFKLCEYLYFNSSQIYAALQKFAIYPVTEINYTSTNESLKKKYKHLHERVLNEAHANSRRHRQVRLWQCLLLDLLALRSFLEMREVRPPHHQAVEYKFRLKKLEFIYKCSACKHKGAGTVIDRKITRPDKIAIIRWDPKLMDIDHNPITGHSEYFYSIPRDLKEKVQKGNKHLINTLPMEFLKALRDEKIFKFSDGQLFHIKMDAPAGIEAQWGFPPLASTIKLFFYAAVLRKANEAIALDYVVPFRIISPRQSSSNADPVQTIPLNRWSEDMKQNVRKWRRDPLHIMWSAVPAEVTHVGGQARALMTLGEVQAAEENIITALGIPKEFIIGGLSFTGSAITLRILENQLMAHTTDLVDLLQWISDKVGRLLGWEQIETSLAPFKFLDDVQQKQLMLQLNQNPQSPLVSNTTLGRSASTSRRSARSASRSSWTRCDSSRTCRPK